MTSPGSRLLDPKLPPLLRQKAKDEIDKAAEPPKLGEPGFGLWAMTKAGQEKFDGR
jgi:hypothetical protein